MGLRKKIIIAVVLVLLIGLLIVGSVMAFADNGSIFFHHGLTNVYCKGTATMQFVQTSAGGGYITCH